MNPYRIVWLLLLTLVSACSETAPPPSGPGAPGLDAELGGAVVEPAAIGADAGHTEDARPADAVVPTRPDSRPDTWLAKLDTIPPAPGMAVPMPPDYVMLPKGCPLATPDIYGLGAKCTKDGGECAGAGDGRVALNCMCDTWDGVRPIDGTPCFCLARVDTPAEPINEFFCRQTLRLMATTTIPYSLRTAPNVARYACLPEACRGVNLSR